MPAAEFPLQIDAGATLRQTFTYSSAATPIDLTAHGVRFILRRSYGEDPVYLSLTSENGGVYATPTQGIFTLFATTWQTAAIPIRTGSYTLDLYTYTATPDIVPLLKGPVDINRDG